MTHPVPPPDLKARVAAHLQANPRAMTPEMAHVLGVPEAEIMRALPGDQCVELSIAGGRAEELIRAFEGLGRVHVIASNDSCFLESYGHFGGFSQSGPYFNVQTDTLDMHIRLSALASAFAVIKPSHQDGQTTYSIQFFDRAGRSGFKVFLYKSVTGRDGGDIAAAIAGWERIKKEFGK